VYNLFIIFTEFPQPLDQEQKAESHLSLFKEFSSKTSLHGWKYLSKAQSLCSIEAIFWLAITALSILSTIFLMTTTVQGNFWSIVFYLGDFAGFLGQLPARKATLFWAIFLLQKDIPKLLNKLGPKREKIQLVLTNSFFMSQLHNFLRVSQNIYRARNFF